MVINFFKSLSFENYQIKAKLKYKDFDDTHTVASNLVGSEFTTETVNC